MVNHISLLYVLPIIAALIGWITNYLAVRMLFRPRKPIKIFGFVVQGVFPKRQKDLAKKVADIIATEFLSSNDLEKSFNRFLHSRELRLTVETKLQSIIRQKASGFLPFLPSSYADGIADKVIVACKDDIDSMFEMVAGRMASSEAIPDVKILIEERIAAFPVDKLEELCKIVLRKEFKFIELIGGVLGFIIGVVQMLIAYFA